MIEIEKQVNTTLIDKSKALFLERLNNHKEDPWNLRSHVPEAEKWAKKILKRCPKVDCDVVMCSVWLYDIGHYPIVDRDHAVISEEIAAKFFEAEKADKEFAKQVLHCIRSHRNRDVAPSTAEAKLLSMIDSISHFTYLPYFKMVQDVGIEQTLAKLERDYRDIKPFPEIHKEITPLYKAIKKLLTELRKIDLE